MRSLVNLPPPPVLPLASASRSLPSTEFRNVSAYVMQDDVLPQYLTAEEIFDFAARMRLGGVSEGTPTAAGRAVLVMGARDGAGMETCRA